MGPLYGRAFLVIAASGATNWTEGCFGAPSSLPSNPIPRHKREWTNISRSSADWVTSSRAEPSVLAIGQQGLGAARMVVRAPTKFDGE